MGDKSVIFFDLRHHWGYDGLETVHVYMYTVRPNKKETHFISEISSLPHKIETKYMLHYQEQFLFFHLIPNT